MSYHQAFLNYISSLGNAQDLLRVCKAYKTAAGNASQQFYAFELNGRLKGGLPLGSFASDFPILQSLFCATLRSPITLYRMTSDLEFSGPLLQALDGPFRYQAFMSTADTPIGLSSFTPYGGNPLLLKIECPPGIALAPLDLFPGIRENEYLLGCGTTFEPASQPRALSAAEARQYIPNYNKNSLCFLELKAIANPPYVNAANLMTL